MQKDNGLSMNTFIPLYREKERYILLAFHYLNDMEKAKDIVSDSFIYLLEHRESLDDNPLKMKGYLLQTIKHKCLNELKRNRIREIAYKNILEVKMSVLSDESLTWNIAEKDIREVLRLAGGKMKKETLDIYVSSRFGDLSHKELSKLYGMTVNRIAKEISKASKIMHEIVRKYLHIIIALLAMTRQ